MILLLKTLNEKEN